MSLIPRYLFCLSLLASNSVDALQPEDILGKYWLDPLFGVASAQHTVRVEVLYRLLFPETIDIDADSTTRFVFENKTEEVHVFLFSEEVDATLEDEEFQLFVEDEVRHATMDVSSSDGHVHSNSNTDDAKSIVGSLSDRPTMTIQPGDKREIIIRFDTPTTVHLRCVLEGHEELEHESVININ